MSDAVVSPLTDRLGRALTDTPDLGPLAADWTPIVAHPHTPFGRSYVSGEPEGSRVRIRFYHRAEDDRVLSRVWFGPGCIGPPAHAHGGSLAAVLDEVMGLTAWHANRPVLLARLTTHNRAKLPLRRVVTCEAWIEASEGRKITVCARLLDEDGTLYVEADGLFIDVGWDKFRQMLAEEGIEPDSALPR